MCKQKGLMIVIVMFTTFIAISVFAPGSARAATSIASLTLTTTSVVGGTSSKGTVVLSGAAPWSGILVSLTSSGPSVASVPRNVTVRAGQKSANFTITTYSVSISKAVNITASYNGSKKTAVLAVNPAPPMITGHPVNKTVNEGQTATFTVTATGSGLSYQWERLNNGTWADVTAGTGGTTTSCTTAPTILADNGAQFRCRVKNSAGTATSIAATLTV